MVTPFLISAPQQLHHAPTNQRLRCADPLCRPVVQTYAMYFAQTILFGIRFRQKAAQSWQSY